ncbi:MAG: DUF6766 family protein [Thermomicrobiales bacterium]
MGSFFLHAIGGAGQFSEERIQQGGPAVSALQYLTTLRFRYESLQNWQSEFLAVGSTDVLSVFLRRCGSPESKPVAAPPKVTGST